MDRIDEWLERASNELGKTATPNPQNKNLSNKNANQPQKGNFDKQQQINKSKQMNEKRNFQNFRVNQNRQNQSPRANQQQPLNRQQPQKPQQQRPLQNRPQGPVQRPQQGHAQMQRPQPKPQFQMKPQSQPKPQVQPQVKPLHSQSPHQKFPNQKQKPASQSKPAHHSQPNRPPQSKSQPQQNKPPQPQAKKPGGNSPQFFRSSGQRIGKPVDKKNPQPKSTLSSEDIKDKVKIIPLGGLNEVGKNMMAFEYEGDIIVVDMGFEFPGEDLLGVDYIIPDTTYLEENKHKIKGIVLTHGHLDHIGGIPYILPKLNYPPLFGTKLTMGLVKKRIDEFDQEKFAKLSNIDPDVPLRLGKFLLKFFRVAHSIPDSVGVVIETPIGKLVHTGDFKFDESPAGFQKKADMDKIRALGGQNVLALFSDSTNSLKPGKSISESEVGKTLEELIMKTPGRIIIASFSTLIGRMQQIIDYSQKHNRKVFVSGRSMRETMEIASNLGFMKFAKDVVKDIKQYKNKTPDHETLILTTGSQGEAVSALTRIANQDHPHIKVKKGDTFVISSSPIVGNERAIYNVINHLCLLGAQVITNQIMDVHTSGHGYQDDLKMMIDLVKPKYFVPVHGEYFMRQAHGFLAHERCGIPEENIVMIQNGDVLLAEKGGVVRKSDEKVETKYIVIDGLGEGEMGSQVQTDRQIMARNGSLVVLVHINKKTKALKKIPDVVSRGFMYMHETDAITQEIAQMAGEAYKAICKKNKNASRQDVKHYIKQSVDRLTHMKLERRPLIIPLIIED